MDGRMRRTDAQRDTLSEVWREVEQEPIHAPLRWMIYVGNGGSDVPAFSLMQDQGGITLAVF